MNYTLLRIRTLPTTVLSKYKIQSTGPFDEEVSATVKRCFEVFLKDNLFQDEAAIQIEQFTLGINTS